MAVDRYVTRRRGVAVDEVSLGYQTLRLLPVDELTEAQQGYSGSDWSPHWLVIAHEDLLGDPIFTDLSDELLPVYTAAHGEGVWEPVQIADSFDSFVLALGHVASVSSGREHPVGLEENPLPEAEREQVLARIGEANPQSDLEFWKSWFEV